MENWDVIVIGGGAAGLLCAITAGQRGRRVLLVEHSERVGKKISISGGGRCNFTNIYSNPESFISANPHFCKSALARYTPTDFIALVERHRIAYHEKKLGQLFCDGSSQQIIDMLLEECSHARVEVRCQVEVRDIEKLSDGRFQLETNNGVLYCASLVIASGGISIPPLGATDFGYRTAKQFGLQIEPPRPALVPFKLPLDIQERLTPISGISVDVVVSCDGHQFRENMLVTHRGLSGPAILQISSYWQPGQALSINLLPDLDVLELLAAEHGSEIELANLLARYLPKRFARAWCDLFFPSKPLKQYQAADLKQIAGQLQGLIITPAGTEGFKKAEVTAGGVSTAELSSQTMEAKKVPGLYFTGEVVDVTGHLGGHNFQWAWASGFVAGNAV
ncbi:MAG TPA: NAD(P)/FAD-dependent oxidoreductase [Pyrinomonadaceae bacterium]|nr:NAD(P)/FAD-dependent oxidoreductase [Pyrinomonadaceae bacterium]